MADYNTCFGEVDKVIFPPPSSPGNYYVISAVPGFPLPTGVIVIPGTQPNSALGYYYLSNHISTLGFRYTEVDSGGTPVGLPVTERYIVSNCGGITIQQPCKNVATIVWLDNEYAWRSYTFTFRIDLGIEPGETLQFINANNERFNSQKIGVRQSGSIFSGEISKQDVEWCESLKYSIQAYFFNGLGLFPITIVPESFVLYSTEDSIFRYSFKAEYSREIRIQTQ